MKIFNILVFLQMIIKNSKNKYKDKVIDIPLLTLISLFTLFGLYFLMWFLEEQKALYITLSLGFTPLLYSDFSSIKLYHFSSPLTYILIHGNIFHLIVNLSMLTAFGSGVERKFGKINFLFIFFTSSLIGIFSHYFIYKNSYIPVIGSSGGICGLFGFYLIHMLKIKYLSNIKILRTVIILIFIFFIFGLIDIIPSTHSSKIAWIVHIGGFLGGVIMYYCYRVISSK